MSAPRREVALSPAARRDVRSILLASRRQWGAVQQDAYRRVLDRALDQLGSYPEIGRQSDNTPPGLRSFPVGQHVIYYRIEPNRIRVARILHAKMDPSDQFEGA